MSLALVQHAALLAVTIGFLGVASTATAQTACPDLRGLSPDSFPVATRILSAALTTPPAAGLPSSLPQAAATSPRARQCTTSPAKR